MDAAKDEEAAKEEEEEEDKDKEEKGRQRHGEGWARDTWHVGGEREGRGGSGRRNEGWVGVEKEKEGKGWRGVQSLESTCRAERLAPDADLKQSTQGQPFTDGGEWPSDPRPTIQRWAEWPSGAGEPRYTHTPWLGACVRQGNTPPWLVRRATHRPTQANTGAGPP